MFNRYWRSYPWALRLALSMLLFFTLFWFTIYLVLVLGPKMAGMPLKDLLRVTSKSDAGTIRVSMAVQIISGVGQYLLPALLIAALTHPRPKVYLGIRPPGKTIHWFIVVLIVAGLVPALLVAENLFMQHVHLGAAADKEQQDLGRIVTAWMSLRGAGNFVLQLATVALIPALGEELMFRGVFLRLFHQQFKRRRSFLSRAGAFPVGQSAQRTMVLPILLSSVMFTAMHSGPYGFAFIFTAGCLLALIYNLTGSILCSMWAHFLYNGSQLGMNYLSASGAEIQIPGWLGLAGLGLLLVGLYALVRTQTPLSANWSSDFAPGEAAPDGI